MMGVRLVSIFHEDTEGRILALLSMHLQGRPGEAPHYCSLARNALLHLPQARFSSVSVLVYSRECVYVCEYVCLYDTGV